ncbi:unnamed protein product [Rangifer tarandus platyrhynchus]|uniref:Uncharacterized protein n=1 Tax=Rangifer tarandus platyrhynchus TaxID=3082113 RepID=A0ABN8XIR8_RANTA|nr:unnamed protein product [Rangifer tarandus platyrhynchus]
MHLPTSLSTFVTAEAFVTSRETLTGRMLRFRAPPGDAHRTLANAEQFTKCCGQQNECVSSESPLNGVSDAAAIIVQKQGGERKQFSTIEAQSTHHVHCRTRLARSADRHAEIRGSMRSPLL